jgi:hypothetical protein
VAGRAAIQPIIVDKKKTCREQNLDPGGLIVGVQESGFCGRGLLKKLHCKHGDNSLIAQR